MSAEAQISLSQCQFLGFFFLSLNSSYNLICCHTLTWQIHRLPAHSPCSADLTWFDRWLDQTFRSTSFATQVHSIHCHGWTFRWASGGLYNSHYVVVVAISNVWRNAPVAVIPFPRAMLCSDICENTAVAAAFGAEVEDIWFSTVMSAQTIMVVSLIPRQKRHDFPRLRVHC